MAEQMLPEVEYRDIPNFPGYRVGNDGSVWSCRKRGFGCDSIDWNAWHRLKVSRDRKGYCHVSLNKDHKTFSKAVHRLVLEAFVGPCPEGMEACHGPVNDASCNRLDNLRWGTKVSNSDDKKLSGTYLSGERIKWAKLTNVSVEEIRRSAAAGETLTALAKQYGVDRSSVADAVYGKTWCDAGGPIGVESPQRKLTDADVIEIRRRKDTATRRALAKEFGVSQSLVSMIVNGVRHAN